MSVDLSKSEQLFTSDWHLYHINNLGYSKRYEFMSPAELEETLAHPERIGHIRYSNESMERMTDAIVDGCNARSTTKTRLYVLGDIIFGRWSRPQEIAENMLAVRERLICQDLHLIRGNHCKWTYWGRGPKKAASKAMLKKIFASVRSQATIGGKQKIFLSHYMPVVWEAHHRASWALYAHSHGGMEWFREEHFPTRAMVDVGIDYRRQLGLGCTPWGLEELRERFKDCEVPIHH